MAALSAHPLGSRPLTLDCVKSRKREPSCAEEQPFDRQTPFLRPIALVPQLKVANSPLFWRTAFQKWRSLVMHEPLARPKASVRLCGEPWRTV
jgi:hypothetical protein